MRDGANKGGNGRAARWSLEACEGLDSESAQGWERRVRAPLVYRRGACFGGHTPPRTHAHARIGGGVGCGCDVKAGRRAPACSGPPSTSADAKRTGESESGRAALSGARACEERDPHLLFFPSLVGCGRGPVAGCIVDGGRASSRGAIAIPDALVCLSSLCTSACILAYLRCAARARACVSASVVGVYCRSRACLLACFDQ